MIIKSCQNISNICEDNDVHESFNDPLCNTICTITEQNFQDQRSSSDTCDITVSGVSDVSNHSNVHDAHVDPLMTCLTSQRHNHPCKIVIAHVNVNSIRHKFAYFHDILSKGLVDVLCISETKLDESFVNNLFHCSGFRCHRKDKTGQSGGIMIWVRADIPHFRVTDLEFDLSCNIECVILFFQLKNVSFYLSCVYKHPSVSNGVFIDNMSALYDKMSNSGSESIVLGDLNIDMMSNNNVIENDLCDVYGLKNLIDAPTCFKSEKGTLIDPVIVSDTSKFCKPFNVVCGSSDWHNLVGCLFNVKQPNPKQYTVTYRNTKTFDESNFKADMERMPTNVCDIFDSADDQYWAFCSMYTDLLDEHAPLKTRSVKGNKIPYMHSELMKAIYKRNQLKNCYFKHRTPTSWEQYRKYRNKVTKMRKHAIKSYFMKYCSKNTSPKQFWQCFKPFFTDKNSNTTTNIILKDNNQIISDTKEVCELLNNFFITIADEIDQPTTVYNNDLSNIYDKYNNHVSVTKIKQFHKHTNVFSFQYVTGDHVHKLIKSLDSNKSMGFDTISPKYVKMFPESLVASFTSIINNAFLSNTFPNDMKKCVVSPLYKKKDHMSKENYRPISILSVFAKVFEMLISEQIIAHMNELFDNRLGAYRKGHGCSQLLTSAIDTWKRALDNNKIVGTLMMDLSKAFDSIPHDLLVAKLNAYGFSYNACTFILTYLRNRQQCVKVRDARSTWQIVKRGIPQGSCLGPLLFNIFVNDLFLCVKNATLFNYADDNTLSVCNSNIDVVIQLLKDDTASTMKWFSDNYMQANPDKFQVMFMKPNLSHTILPNELKIGDVNIQACDKVKLLGVLIDKKLNFDEHIKVLCRKASQQLKILFRFKSMLGLKEKKLMYNTFILSNFNFCPVVWNFCSKTSARKIEKIQERALRYVTGNLTLSYEELLDNTGYTSMHLRRLKCIVIEVFKCIYNMNPAFMNDMFVVKDIPNQLRDPSILVIPRFNKVVYGKKTFSYYGAHLWNLLPNDFKHVIDFVDFKNLLYKWEGPRCQCNICVL